MWSKYELRVVASRRGKSEKPGKEEERKVDIRVGVRDK